jgi:hypothetical protein
MFFSLEQGIFYEEIIKFKDTFVFVCFMQGVCYVSCGLQKWPFYLSLYVELVLI